MTNDDSQQRAHAHAVWIGAAPRWGDHASYADTRSLPLTEHMVAALGLQPGQRVLELACGPGGAGMAVAERLAGTGEVVLSDVAPPMVEIAARRAAERGLGNVSARVLDLEAIDEPDASFDALLCREGLMFAVEPARAVGELARVLKAGGRASVAVWGPRERNPWLGVVFDAVSDVTGFPVPPPGMPGPFALSDAVQVRSLFDAAGFQDVEIDEVAAPVRAASFDEWWNRTTALAGPLADLFAAFDADTHARLRAAAEAGAAPYATPDGLELPGVSLVLAARR